MAHPNQAAQDLCRDTMDAIMRFIVPGMTERQIKEELDRLLMSNPAMEKKMQRTDFMDMPAVARFARERRSRGCSAAGAADVCCAIGVGVSATGFGNSPATACAGSCFVGGATGCWTCIVVCWV